MALPHSFFTSVNGPFEYKSILRHLKEYQDKGNQAIPISTLYEMISLCIEIDMGRKDHWKRVWD